MDGMTRGTEHTQVTHQLCLLCCSCSAAAMAHGPPRTFLLFVLKGVTVTNFGNPDQVDTNCGRSEPGPASISIEI